MENKAILNAAQKDFYKAVRAKVPKHLGVLVKVVDVEYDDNFEVKRIIGKVRTYCKN